jgi:flagellar motor switch protein FliN/FliY
MSATEAESSGEENGEVEKANFDALDQSADAAAAPDGPSDVNLEVVLNVNVDLALEVGRTSISVRELLQLNQGSIVELDRLAGEPLDVLINGTLVARGEVVVVNDKYGIRLTDVISPTERIKQFQ